MLDFFASSYSVPMWALLSIAAFILLLILALWSMRHRHEPHYEIDSDKPAIELMPSIVGLTHGHLVQGNAATLVQDGAYFDSLLDDIDAASASIHFETFLWKDGEIGRKLGEALAARAEAGLEVRVLVDANGSKDMGEGTIQRLKQSGVQFAWFHEIKLRHFARLNARDHRKMAIIDGRIAYVGGHCVVDTWTGHAQDGEHFRDVSLRVTGPVVHQVQSVFSENWVESTGDLFLGDSVFPHLEPQGDIPAHVIRLHLEDVASDIEVLHLLMIRLARERISIQNPYFIPDPEAIQLLLDAVQRGVEVRVMVPSTSASDMPIVQLAAHRNFLKMLRGGIRIYEYEKTLLHQKLMTIDGTWACIGSANFDDRSFEINKEVTLGVCDDGIVAELDSIFEKDLEHCTQLDADEWAKRPLKQRALEHFLYFFNEQI